MFAAIVGQAWADDAHPFSLEINSIDWINRVEFRTIRVEMAGPGSNGSLTFIIRDKDATVSVNEWDEVRLIEHAATRPILFGGFVQSHRFETWARTGRDIAVTCVGYGILLDRKIVTDHDPDGGLFAGAVGDNAIALAGRFGGRIQASGYYSSNILQTDAIHGVAQLGNYWTVDGPSGPFTPPSIETPTTLRGALDAISSIANSIDPGDGPGGEDLVTPAPMVAWVDSAWMLRVLPDPVTTDRTGWAPSPNHGDQRFDDTVPGFQIDTSGTYRVLGVEYEREDTDRLTTAYVHADPVVRTGPDQSSSSARFVGLQDMIRGTYGLLNSGKPDRSPGGFLVTVTHVSAGTTDTLGTIVVKGRDLFGHLVKEAFTPDPDRTITGSQIFRQIIAVKGHGWEAVGGSDSIKVGHSSDSFSLDTKGTGYYRLPPLERAGDLEVLVENGEYAELSTDVASIGGPAVAQTTAATVRGSVGLYSATPLSIWPGRRITLTWPPVGLDSAQEWRATSVTIAFVSTAVRTYSVGFGGSLPQPSMARRSGRFGKRGSVGSPGGSRIGS